MEARQLAAIDAELKAIGYDATAERRQEEEDIAPAKASCAAWKAPVRPWRRCSARLLRPGADG
jgi:hypothetical protein